MNVSGQFSGVVMTREWMTSTELREFLGIKTMGTLRNWERKGTGPPFHWIGSHRKYDRAEVEAWLAARRVPAAGEVPS